MGASVSKLREQAAKFINDAGFKCKPSDIVCVSGYWKKQDCYRFEVFNGRFHLGCWLTLTKFVKECKLYGGAIVDSDSMEVDPL